MKKLIFICILSLLAGSTLAGNNRTYTLPESDRLVYLTDQFTSGDNEQTRDLQVITNPQGSSELYCVNSSFLNQGSIVIDKLSPAHLVFTRNNLVYLENPSSAFRTGTYLKGDYDVPGEKIRVDLPQAIYESNGMYLVVNKMKRRPFSSADSEGPEYDIVDDEDNYLIYNFNINDLSLDLGNPIDSNDPEYILGICDQSGNFFGIADFYQEWTPFTETPATLPDGLTFESYEVKDESYPLGFVSKVAFTDDDEVYMKNIFPNNDEYFIKGTRKGNQIIFPTPQYQGVSREHKAFIWICGMAPNDRMLPAITLTCDDDCQTLKAEDQRIVLNADYRTLYYIDYLINPTFTRQGDEVNADPVDPELVEGMLYDPEIGYGYVTWGVDPINVKGNAIDPERMAYNVWVESYQLPVIVDGKVLGEVPSQVDFQDPDGEYRITASFGQITVYFAFPASTFGLKVLYNGTDGVTYSSNRVNVNVEEGVESLDAEPIEVQYYTLTGIKVGEPRRGIYIKVTRYADGSIKNEKILINK